VAGQEPTGQNGVALSEEEMLEIGVTIANGQM
jgi:hypothetical protein